MREELQSHPRQKLSDIEGFEIEDHGRELPVEIEAVEGRHCTCRCCLCQLSPVSIGFSLHVYKTNLGTENIRERQREDRLTHMFYLPKRHQVL